MDSVPTAPSPFLPGTKIQYALDSTSLGNFKTCPRLYYYTNILGWQPKEETMVRRRPWQMPLPRPLNHRPGCWRKT